MTSIGLRDDLFTLIPRFVSGCMRFNGLEVSRMRTNAARPMRCFHVPITIRSSKPRPGRCWSMTDHVLSLKISRSSREPRPKNIYREASRHRIPQPSAAIMPPPFRAKRLDLSCFINVRVLRDHAKRKAFEQHETQRYEPQDNLLPSPRSQYISNLPPLADKPSDISSAIPPSRPGCAPRRSSN
jgi:hypothetical protein